MAKSLGGAVIELLDSERVELRTAAATVLAAVGKGDKAVETALTSRLEDPDGVVRRIALDALADMGTGGIAGKLVPLLHGDDEELAARAASVLAQQGAAAEATLRKEVAGGPIAARRVMAQLLVRRGTVAALDAVLDQLADPEFGEQALQLVRAALDEDGGDDKLATMIEKAGTSRAGERAKELSQLAKATAKAAAKVAKPKGKASASNGNGHAQPAVDPELARLANELGALLRLIGYLGRPSTQSMLLGYTDADQPRSVRLAAIAGLRRIVATSEAKGTEKVIEELIALAAGDDLAVAQAAVDTLRGARIPEALAKPFAGLAKSKNAAAQKLAMERLPAGGGAGAVKALVEALGGDDPTARDAAARGLAKAPEAVLPMMRAMLATSDEQIARRYAGALRSHRGNVSNQAIDELVDRVQSLVDAHLKGKVTADDIVMERVLAELVADLAPARHVELLFERAKRLRKQGKSVEAFGSLKPLLRTRADLDAAIDGDQRYLLALLALEAAGEGLIRTMKGDDPVLEQFARLAATGFPVAKQLAKEDAISDEVLYALGFRLLESGDGRNEELGAELLQGIIDERPRSKLAKAAKNKLKLTGHLDE
jgi:HEAT repeat protein